MSAAGAASALIGEALGKGDVLRAAAMLRAASALVLLMVAGYAGALLPLRGALATLLGGGVAAVEAAYARTLPVVLSMHLLDGCDLPRSPDISRDLRCAALACRTRARPSARAACRPRRTPLPPPRRRPFNVFKAWLTVRKKQAFGAVMTVGVYYCFGVPLGAWLAWRAYAHPRLELFTTSRAAAKQSAAHALDPYLGTVAGA